MSLFAQLLNELKNLEEDSVDAYPDNDSKREGYTEGLRDAILKVEKYSAKFCAPSTP